MNAVIKIHINELNESLIATLHKLFDGRDVEITISDSVKTKTEPKKYQAVIDERIQKVEEGEELVYLSIDELKKMAGL
ncbi:MAG: hypothetical protein ABI723_06720 [Bacteroidia bacterium]